MLGVHVSLHEHCLLLRVGANHHRCGNRWKLYNICLANGHRNVKDLIKCANFKVRAAALSTSTAVHRSTTPSARVQIPKANLFKRAPETLSVRNTSSSFFLSSSAAASSSSVYVPSAPLTGSAAVASLQSGSIPSDAPILSIGATASTPTASPASATGPLASLTAQAAVSSLQDGSIPSAIPVVSVSFSYTTGVGTSETTVVSTVMVLPTPMSRATTLTSLVAEAPPSSTSVLSSSSWRSAMSYTTMTVNPFGSTSRVRSSAVSHTASTAAEGRAGGTDTSSTMSALATSTAATNISSTTTALPTSTAEQVCLRRERIRRI